MVDRLTVDEFFNALREQRVYPLVDTPVARQIVEAIAQAEGTYYPIKDRWPVLDLKFGYEGHLNCHPDVSQFARNGYDGTIQLRGFDHTYSIDEWFGDFTTQWLLIDTPKVRKKMVAELRPGSKWRSRELYQAHEMAISGTISGFTRNVRKAFVR